MKRLSSRIIPLTEVTKVDVQSCGGKGAQLGELLLQGMPVPAGFVITVEVYKEFLSQNNLAEQERNVLKRFGGYPLERLGSISNRIQTQIVRGRISKEVQSQVRRAFHQMGETHVVVRSSATVEDSQEHSFAGQLTSFLGVPEDKVLSCVKACWASLFSPRALMYLKARDLFDAKVGVAVVVQQMIDAEVSGVAFTAHPFSKDKNVILIEAVFGLGEVLMSGETAADQYIVDKERLQLLNFHIETQKKMKQRTGYQIQKVYLSPKRRGAGKLSEREVLKLATLCIAIEQYYDFPQDIEWAFAKDQFYILQSRAITTL